MVQNSSIPLIYQKQKTMKTLTEIQNFAKTLNKKQQHHFVDFDFNIINMPRNEIIDAVQAGTMNAIHIELVPGTNVPMQIRVSENNAMKRIFRY